MRPVLLFFLLLSCPAFAQVTIRGTVIDSATRKPVPYALVMETGGKHGALADQAGIFEFTLPDSSGTLLFTCMGYDTTRIAVKRFLASSTKQVAVSHKPLILPTANIISWKTPPCTKKVGVSKKRSRGNVLFKSGLEVALYMPNTGDSGIISKLRFYITKTGVPGTEFRAKLYSVDPETKGPGELLLENELIAGAKKGNEWVEFDITAYHIEIPAEGFFVAMQWLPGAQEYSLDLGKTTYTGEGQVLGLSKETPQKFWIKPFPADWIESFTVPDIIPMIGADVLVKCK